MLFKGDTLSLHKRLLLILLCCGDDFSRENASAGTV
jgi:hypothetical protein